jgi:hypothetical protein
MKNYKLYIDGLQFIDPVIGRRDYKVVISRNAKHFAETYQRPCTITNMSGKPLCRCILDNNGNGIYVKV